MNTHGCNEYGDSCCENMGGLYEYGRFLLLGIRMVVVNTEVVVNTDVVMNTGDCYEHRWAPYSLKR
jgi:hypothetical protein